MAAREEEDVNKSSSSRLAAKLHHVLCRLKRVQNRIQKGFEVFEYYANNQWDFKNESALYIRPLMNERERREYKVDGEGLDFEEYFTDCVKAARVYILKEMPDTIPAARRHMRVYVLPERVVT